MGETVRDFLENSINKKHIKHDTAVEVRTGDGEVLAYSDVESILDDEAEVLDLLYVESDRLDDGMLVIIVEQ